MKLLYPGHKYLGPGNELLNGDPVDRADEIAQEHDYKYNNSDSGQDIFKSDIEGVKNFANDFVTNPNLPSLAGAVGLTAKVYFESLYGHIYPFEYSGPGRIVDSVSELFTGQSYFDKPEKRNIEEDRDMTKRQKTEEPSSTTDGTQDVNPQAGSSLPGGTGADVVATIISNPHLPSTKLMFNKTWQFVTGGYQMKLMLANQFLSFFGDGNLLLTPMQALDPGMLQLYMSPMEYNELPNFTYAKACMIKVTPLGYRLPFQTNEAAAGYANSQTLVQIMHSVGLNTKYNMIATPYTPSASDPTVVTATAVEDNYEEKLYGSQTNTAFLLGANTGKPTAINLYTGIVNGTEAGDSAEYFRNGPNLINDVMIQNVNDCKGMPIINFTHEFKNGLLKIPAPKNANRDVLTTRVLPGPPISDQYAIMSEGVNQCNFVEYSSRVNNDLSVRGSYEDINSSNKLPPYNNYAGYLNTIEKSYYLQNQVGQHQTPDYTPFIHYGVMAVPNNPTLSANETFSPSVVQWQVECSLLCELNLNSTQSFQNVPYTKKWDPVWMNDPDIPRNSGQVTLIANRRAKSVTRPQTDLQQARAVIKMK